MRILTALSGGVDSAVAAARLLREGAEVVAVHYRTGVESTDPAAASRARSCCGIDDARDARAVAARLGVPFYVLDVSEAFGRRVIGAFVDAYASGRTPNPCIACNQDVKFGRLLEVAHGLNAEAVATGHYARTAPGAHGRVRLLRGTDPKKDQSYVLYGLDQRQLAAARFPLGDARKGDVRAEARALGLPVADKPDSQELCFVPTGDHRAVLAERAPGLLREGPVVDGAGATLGRHGGAAAFTVGQRRGLGVASDAPLHVTEVDVARNRLVVGPREALLRRRIRFGPVHWVDLDPALEAHPEPVRVEVRVRHAHDPQPGTLSIGPDGTGRVDVDEPVFAPAPGQALVAYRDEAVLCGGEILDSA
ncbi:MAG TPA: tRNA 2-thiouridine(34) synthase MnmA [Planctomycetota bacterium]|nr:tRNA 2-thiouridine(34) synthase MnmA [Planctomycetota bacterium]